MTRKHTLDSFLTYEKQKSLFTGGLKGSQVKFFVPADVSMVSISNIFTDFGMINFKIFGWDLFKEPYYHIFQPSGIIVIPQV